MKPCTNLKSGEPDEAERLRALVALTGPAPVEQAALETGATMYDHAMKRIVWMTDPPEIAQALATERPGISRWSCKRLGAVLRAQLLRWMASEQSHLSRNSALALGMHKDKAALPLLHIHTGSLLSYCRSLSMQDELLSRQLCWQSPGGKRLQLDAQRFVSQAGRNVAAIRYALTFPDRF